ncbi:MAG: T9SS type A sorting domain-containing protein [Bacteroidales bacterium]|nr:T9SS type A sorting domain-containing protein [Bacteroidales bacterium]
MRLRTLIMIVLLGIGHLLPAQEKDSIWEQVYHEGWYVTPLDLTECYDKGYMVSGRIAPYNYQPYWTWLIKTDVNGELLWEKKIGDGQDKYGCTSIKQLDDGGYILFGGTTYVEKTNHDPFVIKLNACWEKEWCRIYHVQDQFDATRDIFPMKDGGYLAYAPLYGDNIPEDRIVMLKLDSLGELEWTKVYYDSIPRTFNETGVRGIKSKINDSYIFTGWTGYEDKPGSNLYWNKPFWFSIDKKGNEEWYEILFKSDSVTCEADQSIEDQYGNIYGIGNRQFKGHAEYTQAMFKLNKKGEYQYYKSIFDTTPQGYAHSINLLTDTTLIIGGAWSNTDGSTHGGVIRTDTMGNVLNYEILSDWNSPGQIIRTFDGKALAASSISMNNKENKGIYLHKFNAHLEYDSVYTQPFEYDYLCDEPIPSDTMDLCDCIITDVEEIKPGKTQQKLKLYPNPAQDELNITLPESITGQYKMGSMNARHTDYRYKDKAVIKIYDIHGHTVKQAKTVSGQEEMHLNISALSAGIYMVALEVDDKYMARGKFVKK